MVVDMENRGLATLMGQMSTTHGQTLAVGAAVTMPVEDDQARIRALYRQERESIARHLMALTGDRASVDDLINETFIRAFQSLGAFSGRSSIRTWVHGIAVNVARNHRAKRRRRAAAPLGVSTPPPVDTPEDELSRRQAVDRFHRALDRLEPRLREVFVLRVIEEHSLKEVGEMLAIPVSTAHARAARAEQLVRAHIEGDGGEQP